MADLFLTENVTDVRDPNLLSLPSLVIHDAEGAGMLLGHRSFPQSQGLQSREANPGTQAVSMRYVETKGEAESRSLPFIAVLYRTRRQIRFEINTKFQAIRLTQTA